MCCSVENKGYVKVENGRLLKDKGNSKNSLSTRPITDGGPG